MKLRDKIKDKEYFEERYNFNLNAYKRNFSKIEEHLSNKIKEEALVCYFYDIFIT